MSITEAADILAAFKAGEAVAAIARRAGRSTASSTGC